MNSIHQGSKKVFGQFVDSSGNKFDLITGFRDAIKPWWRNMFKTQAYKPPSRQEVCSNLSAWNRKIVLSEIFLNTIGFSFKNKKIVEIGDSQGYAAYALSALGASHVVATDVNCYYENQMLLKSSTSGISKNQMIWEILKKLNSVEIQQRVEFKEDNICHSGLPSRYADIVLSWEVLEHISHPLEGFQNMSRILKPGGIAFHEYNPFHALDGGHSLCTLDFPWGHVRLNSQDFIRYISSIRPQEKKVALNFYFENLNRMTISDLKNLAREAGFQILSLIPWSNQQHLSLLEPHVLKECQKHYPSLNIQDLISPTIWIVLIKTTGKIDDNNLVYF